ncbi:hypothetical protein [Streptomyces sp. NPDC048224]|uniref:hypothetical protein n=1 Tax=Streptomyces sp. NPDC048224 TaxID=3154500 RepID=UPI0033D1F574
MAGGVAADLRGDTGGGVPPETGDVRVCVCSGREGVAARRWTGGWAPVGVPGRPVGAEGRFAGPAGSAASPEDGGGVTWAAARCTGAVGVLGAGPSAGAPAGYADERAGGASPVRSVRWTGDAGREAPAAGVGAGAGADEDAGAGDDAAGPRAARCTGRSDAALPVAGADGFPGAGAGAGAGAVRGGVLDAGAVPESGPAADTARCTGSSPVVSAGAAPDRGTARWAGAGAGAEPGARLAGLRDAVSPSAPERETGGPRPARGRVARWTGGPGGAESGAVGRRSPEGAGCAAGAEAVRAVGAGPEGGVAARRAAGSEASGVPLPDSCALRCTGVPDDEAGRFRTGAGAGAGPGAAAVPGSPVARCPDVPDGDVPRPCAPGDGAAPVPDSRVVRCTGVPDGDEPRP